MQVLNSPGDWACFDGSRVYIVFTQIFQTNYLNKKSKLNVKLEKENERKIETLYLIFFNKDKAIFTPSSLK